MQYASCAQCVIVCTSAACVRVHDDDDDDDDITVYLRWSTTEFYTHILMAIVMFPFQNTTRGVYPTPSGNIIYIITIPAAVKFMFGLIFYENTVSILWDIFYGTKNNKTFNAAAV